MPRRMAPTGGHAAGVLAATILLAPALGATSETLLQDTFKSALVSFGALAAALLMLVAQRRNGMVLQWHRVVLLPLLLMAYALGSMAWSHAYLAGVEAVRWFVFALIVWVALDSFTRERLPWLAACIHAGALIASAWAALQFWTGFSLFPQGPNPASTFFNRNFFAEFAVCAVPFGMLLLARSRTTRAALLLAASLGFILVAILMSGTRSALLALWLQLLVVLPLIAWRCRRQLAWSGWSLRLRCLAGAAFVGTVLVLGVLPSGNASIIEEGYGAAPLLRGVARTQSVGPADSSLSLRLVMWRATLDAIRDRPLAGLGAGAWENRIPLYLPQGSQLETDYYAHNEALQLVAEYGLAGWAFLLALALYLLQAAWRGWRDESSQADADRPWRAVLLCSLLALMVVSNAGFPWRLAATGALFALCLGALAASDLRLGHAGRPLRWSAAATNAALAAVAGCVVLAVAITQRAALSERKLVTAKLIAQDITAEGDFDDPRHDARKAEMLRLVREGIALHPHYRKITPVIADELARWGDWRNATWIWESVLASRPYVVAILTNAARGHASIDQVEQARGYLERARALQPDAPSVRSFEVILLARSGQEALAMRKAREALAAGIVDHDLVNSAFLLAWRAGDRALAMRLLRQRMEGWPETQALGHVQLGLIQLELQDASQALDEFRTGLALASPAERAALLPQIPPALRWQIGPHKP